MLRLLSYRRLLVLLFCLCLSGARVHAQASYGHPVGTHPTLAVPLRFADTRGITPHSRAWYEHLMAEVSHFYTAASYGKFNLEGGKVLDFIDLPKAADAYMQPAPADPSHREWDLNKLMAGVLDSLPPDVDLDKYWQVNFFPNTGRGASCFPIKCQWRGRTKFLSGTYADGYFAQHATVVHEIGHTLGFDHNTDTNGNKYNTSCWSPMGNITKNPTPDMGNGAVELTAFHRFEAGWLEPRHVLEVPPGSNRTFRLERLGDPVQKQAYRMAQVFIANQGGVYYCLEARRTAGYDKTGLPGEGVVIHLVDVDHFFPYARDASVGSFGERSRVVDGDGNGNAGDAGAVWTPDKTFTDAANGISIHVDAMDATGCTVTVHSRAGVFRPGVVTQSGDAGAGSLRDAIKYANEHPGAHITFEIPATDPNFHNGIATIHPTTILPLVRGDNIVVDGASESAFLGRAPGGAPTVFLDGGAIGECQGGLFIESSGCTVQNLALGNWKGSAILVNGLNGEMNFNKGGKGNRVVRCYIGIDPVSMKAAPNFTGITLNDGAGENVIGGNKTRDANVVSGNKYNGIYIFDAATVSNRVEGNLVGTNPAGSAAIPNGLHGVEITGGARLNTIGGSSLDLGNVFSGNKSCGIAITVEGTSENKVFCNFVGTDVKGDAPIPNRDSGIAVTRGASRNVIGAEGRGNLVAGNGGGGIALASAGTRANHVSYNYVGLNLTGDAPLANGGPALDQIEGAADNIADHNKVYIGK